MSDRSEAAPAAPPLSERQVTRGMALNIASGSLGMVYVAAALGMPLPLLMDAIHASGEQLGLLSAAWQFAMLAHLPSTILADRLRKRKPLWGVVSLVHRLLWGIPALLPFLFPHDPGKWPIGVVWALILSNFLGQAGSGPWQSWMADLIPPSRAGRFWGRRQSVMSAPLVVSALAFGYILDRWTHPPNPFLGFQIVFACACVFGCGDILLHVAVAEPPMQHRKHPSSPLAEIIAPLKDRGFLLLTLIMGLWAGSAAMLGYTTGLPGFFAMAYVKETFGVTFTQASWIFVCSGVGAFLWTPRMGRLLDELGARKTLTWLVLSGPLCMLVWLLLPAPAFVVRIGNAALPSAVLLLCVASLVIGGLYSAVYVSQLRLAQSHTNPESRTISMGVHWSLSGLIASVGPLFAGWLKDHLAGHGFPPPVNGAAPIGFFQILVLIHVFIAWCIVLPLVRNLPGPR